MTSLLRILPLVLLTAGLTACGLKGDLYLEEPEVPAEIPDAAPVAPDTGTSDAEISDDEVSDAEIAADEALDTEMQDTGAADDEMPVTATPEQVPAETDAPETDSIEAPAADDAS